MEPYPLHSDRPSARLSMSLDQEPRLLTSLLHYNVSKQQPTQEELAAHRERQETFEKAARSIQTMVEWRSFAKGTERNPCNQDGIKQQISC